MSKPAHPGVEPKRRDPRGHISKIVRPGTGDVQSRAAERAFRRGVRHALEDGVEVLARHGRSREQHREAIAVGRRGHGLEEARVDSVGNHRDTIVPQTVFADQLRPREAAAGDHTGCSTQSPRKHGAVVDAPLEGMVVRKSPAARVVHGHDERNRDAPRSDKARAVQDIRGASRQRPPRPLQQPAHGAGQVRCPRPRDLPHGQRIAVSQRSQQRTSVDA